MQEDSRIQFQDLDQVLHSAQLRRSADLGVWLRQYIEDRRRRMASNATKNERAAPQLNLTSNLLTN